MFPLPALHSEHVANASRRVCAHNPTGGQAIEFNEFLATLPQKKITMVDIGLTRLDTLRGKADFRMGLWIYCDMSQGDLTVAWSNLVSEWIR